MKILVCEDEQILRERICRDLTQQGYEVISCADSQELYEKMNGMLDLLLLDVHLPDGCIYETIAMLQESYSIPIIFFSSDTEESLMLRGYDFDCITFMPKPVKPRILMATVNAFARRNHLLQEDIQCGKWIWKEKQHQLVNSMDENSKDKKIEITLSSSEARIFLVLFRHQGKTVSKEMLMSSASDQCTDASLRVRLAGLRKKLPKDMEIETVRNTGYRLHIKEDDV